jgi:hypothetical protein
MKVKTSVKAGGTCTDNYYDCVQADPSGESVCASAYNKCLGGEQTRWENPWAPSWTGIV